MLAEQNLFQDMVHTKNGVLLKRNLFTVEQAG